MTAYYNENDPYAAQWLRNLVSAGHIAPGEVDERSIEDVTPDEIAEFTQCHFFAGVGVWSHSLRLAGWPDDRPVWTGSCPCQPFSAAGKRGGVADERHLWPHWHWLIEQRRPPVVFGEQVASKDGLAWIDLVQADLEGAGYAVAPFDLCAAGFGAPHIRQRLYFVADSDDQGPQGRRRAELRERADQCATRASGASGRMVDSAEPGRESWGRAAEAGNGGDAARIESGRLRDAGRMEHAGGERRERREAPAPRHDDDRQASERSEGEYGTGEPSAHRIHRHGTGPTNGHWRAADWLYCRDGKWRPVEPGTFPLAHGIAGRVGRLRAYGNAIVAAQAVEFVRVYRELSGAISGT